MIKISKVISTRQRYDYDKDRKSDIDKAKRQGEEDHEEVKRRGEENFNDDEENTMTTRRSEVILKRRQPQQGY